MQDAEAKIEKRGYILLENLQPSPKKLKPLLMQGGLGREDLKEEKTNKVIEKRNKGRGD